MKTLFYSLFVMIIFSSCSSSQPTTDNADYLVRFQTSNQPGALVGYADSEGTTIIKPGKYIECLSDTIRTMGIVVHEQLGFFGINKKGEELFRIYQFDNGPDEPSEGLFRIVKDQKIGYANLDGEIIVKPAYTCAFPFENGKARVSTDCKSTSDGEHTEWTSDRWFYINNHGQEVKN